MRLNRNHILAVLALVLYPCLALAQVWQAGPSVPTSGSAPRTHGAAVMVGSSIYLLGGTPFIAGNGSSHRHSGGTWYTTTETEGDFLGVRAAIDNLGRFIVMGGIDAGGNVGEPYEWTVADGDAGGVEAPNSEVLGHNSAEAVDDSGLILLIGGGPGATATAGDPNVADVEGFDGAADAWTQFASLPLAVADAAACNDRMGRILVFGGFDAAGVPTTEVQAFDMATGTWSTTLVPDMPTARTGHAAVRGVDGRIYVIGGSNGTMLASVDVLDPVSLTWAAGPALATARRHFGCTVDDAGNIHVIGGETATGGTNGTELLDSAICPRVLIEPVSRTAFLGGPCGLSVAADGIAPLTYQWRKGGVPLVDGVQASGSTIVGATTPDLAIQEAAPGDGGAYDCVIANGCGAATTATATITLAPTADVPARFAVSVLHPAGSTASVARGADDGEIVGAASYPHPQYNSLSHPIYWASVDAPGVDITPAGSVGGHAEEIENGTIVGWYWWPYTVPQGTGYNQHASVWTNSGANHINAQYAGFEFGSISDTDGTYHVGSQRYDESSTNSAGFLWITNNSARQLTPPSAWGSNLTAIDGGEQFGSVHWGYGVVKATAWSGTSGSWRDMSPAASGFSAIYGAGDGQQVGRITLGGVSTPALWGGTAESAVSLGSGSVSDCEGGLQVGTSTINGVSSAVLWRGSAASMVDLHAFVPSQYSSSTAAGIDIASDGTVTIVGSGYDAVEGRTEALVWRGRVATLTQDVATISAAAGGSVTFTVDGGPALAGRVWLLLGSITGTSPGLPLGGGLELPLVPDVYTNILLSDPAAWISPVAGLLGPDGIATTVGNFPGGVVAVPGPFSVHHAFVVLSADFLSIDAVSPATSLVIAP